MRETSQGRGSLAAEPAAPERMESWKEIAAYLGRSVRTVERWRAQEGLPVHRIHGGLGRVYALRSELDAWWGERRPQLEIEGEAPKPPRDWRGRWLVISVSAALLGFAGGSTLKPAHEPLRLAVLPFQNLSAGSEQDYVSDGLTEELIAQLGRARLDGVAVLARTSVMPYKRSDTGLAQIGRDLRADYVVEGSVRHEGRKLRITAQLVRVHDQAHLWAESYDRTFGDILSVQNEVAAEVAGRIPIELPPDRDRRSRDPQVDEPAYRLYLKGRFAWNKRTAEDLQEALGYFGEATARDPAFARAYAGLADTWSLLSYYGGRPPREVFPKAKSAALRALELDPQLPEALTSLAYVAHRYEWAWSTAEQGYRKAIAQNPSYATAHHWYAEFLMSMGRLDEARQEMWKAQELDSLSPRIQLDMGLPDYFAREPQKGIVRAREVLSRHPGFVPAHVSLRHAYERAGMYAEAIAELRQTYALLGLGPEAADTLSAAYSTSGPKGYWKAGLALGEAARAQPQGSVLQAVQYAAAGERVRALDALEKAFAERDDEIVWIGVEPAFDTIRSEPRFLALLERVGLHGIRVERRRSS